MRTKSILGWAVVAFLIGFTLFGLYELIVHLMQLPGQTIITNAPVGITYNGPPTKALAAYYCIKDLVVSTVGFGQCTYSPITGYNCTYVPSPAAYHAPNYSIQMGTVLDNSYLVQVIYNGTLYLIVWGNDDKPIINTANVQLPTCGWLILTIRHGVLHLGIASAGGAPTWVLTQPIGDVAIEPGPNTGIFLSSMGNGIGVGFENLDVVMSLWYWNETLGKWVPAKASPGSGLASGFVLIACVTYASNTGVITTLQHSQCPNIITIPKTPTPNFKP